MVTISGSIEEIVFYNPENGYCVLAINCQDDMLTVVGTFPELAIGEKVEVTGEFIHHPRFGQQLKASAFQRILPVDVLGIERYLASGLIKGIGSHFASQIVRKFGTKTLEVIDKHPQLLLDVPGIGGQKVQQIIASWRDQKNVYEVMTFLQSIDVTTNLAIKICRQYGARAVEIVRQDPYRLAQDIQGIGFITADRIAASQGLPKDHPSRIQAGLVFILREMVSEGHVYLPRPILEQKAVEMLRVERQHISQAIENCAHHESEVTSPSAIIVDSVLDPNEERIYLLPYYVSEIGVVERLTWIIHSGEKRSRISGSTLLLPSLINSDDITAEQRIAVENALRHPVSVMTGGPGTGKSYTIATLIAAIESLGKKYVLAAPTGRAAKRLTESTERKASTIHRMLSYVPDDEQEDLMVFDDPQVLDFDMIVIDEASMLDLPLAYRMLKAIPAGCHLLLVGDVDQLPSVGAGNFLHDVIESEAVPVTRLTEIFRQAASSLIVANAHRINQGLQPILENNAEGDFYFFSIETGLNAAEQVQSLVTDRIPKKFGLRSDEIQVLSPMYRGEAGVKNLNMRLQDSLNPLGKKKKERILAGTRFREGDRVMQIKNEYEKEVFNGDIGRLVSIDEEDSSLLVEVDGRGVTYNFSEADQLVLAYATTIHKSQGSE
ncbi:MAG: ATP-dependent RecD-like DNA helicase, partial [Anaerolineaceae bacterium]|nr:ATP-dependent RecD-like DNA helicase [Anaerolineaceae bacterium]